MIDQPTKIRIVKLGGSLLEFCWLRCNLCNWLAKQIPMRTIWIVGGGKLVDAIRRDNGSNQLNSMEAHFKSIEMMEVNSRRIQSLIPDCGSTNDPNDIFGFDCVTNLLLLPLNWMRLEASNLPASWDVTSDSIAAAVARSTNADELVLLKSCPPPLGSNLRSLSDECYVDNYFMRALDPESVKSSRTSPVATTEDSLRIRMVDLRSEEYAESSWVL